MAIEIERKFLVKDGSWAHKVRARRSIRQFYVAAATDRSVRVRIIDDNRARLTLKFGTDDLSRHEFELDMPVGEANEMMAFAIGSVIEKVRHEIDWHDHVFEVDVFAGALHGLVVAEVETADVAPLASCPAWLGREVTGDSAYYNSSLALRGLPGEAA